MEKIKGKKQLVFLDVSIDGDPVERMIFELFTDVAPKTTENFRALCTGGVALYLFATLFLPTALWLLLFILLLPVLCGEKGVSAKTGKPLHYKGTFFHRIKRGYLAQLSCLSCDRADGHDCFSCDIVLREGIFFVKMATMENIYDGKFPDESPKLKHDGPGLLSMAIADRDERGSLFSVTFKADRRLDRRCVVFGELVDGHEVLKKIENAGDEEGKPSVTVKIINSGQLHDDIQVTEGLLGVTRVHLEDELLPDIGAGEAGLAVLVCLAVQYAIAAVVIAGAGALFVVDLRLRGIEVHHVVEGEGPRLQGVEADLSCGLHGIHNLQGIQTKATQVHHLEVPHGRQVWSHMEMAQPILDGIDDMAVVVEAAGVASESMALAVLS
ncbi:UNVERIFIED_CONTAM: Peptidyl-prolyl cis-trans isomerase CYP95 [Sesamum calycinum]|uniref:Peptidyl-prolyl cis-trans isomerase CYP95 n=1 Tax=Sesamum calycinum TaxID=2727403 RepID=A0AAW2LXJ0_9LAMI